MSASRVSPTYWAVRLLRVIGALALMGLTSIGVLVTSPMPAHADPPPPPSPTATPAFVLPLWQPAAFARRDYTLHIQRDGTVQVTEHWQLHSRVCQSANAVVKSSSFSLSIRLGLLALFRLRAPIQ